MKKKGNIKLFHDIGLINNLCEGLGLVRLRSMVGARELVEGDFR